MNLKDIIKINTYLAWSLIIGIAFTQTIITKEAMDAGKMAPYLALLSAMLFLPFVITAITSVLNRERQLGIIKAGVKMGIVFQVLLSLCLPMFFDKEFIYFSLLGLVLGLVMYFLRKNIEWQLLILNSIGTLVWIFIAVLAMQR